MTLPPVMAGTLTRTESRAALPMDPAAEKVKSEKRDTIMLLYGRALSASLQLHQRASGQGKHYPVTAEAVQATAFTIDKMWHDAGAK